MDAESMFMYDETEETKTRFVGFFGNHQRFDLAITQTNRFFGKTLVMDIQRAKAAIIGPDDLQEEGYLQHAFGLNDDEAEDLYDFLSQIIM